MITMSRPARAVLAAAVFALLLTSPATAQVGQTLGTLDANLATAEQLGALPGMTPAIIQAVVAGRPYRTMTAFDATLGRSLTAAQRKAIYPRLFLAVNLNTASDAEFNLIPGMGPRMLREFKEYRPWKHEAQFQKEIGKYVDAKEVARLWRYVTIAPAK